MVTLAEIKQSPKTLLHILQRLGNLDTELAMGCLQNKQQDWEKLSEQLASKGGTKETKTSDDIEAFYNDRVRDI